MEHPTASQRGVRLAHGGVLDVYHRPYDPARPVVCFDKVSCQLLRDVPPALPPTLGRPERVDYEYVRGGTVNLFLACEPLAGLRGVTVTERRTKQDFAQQIKTLVDERFPEVEQIVLVLDNLNTHTPAALYETFSPAEARRLTEKLQWHYTPKHGSWLNIAEIELSVLNRQCLDRRVPDRATLKAEIATWQQRRNTTAGTIDWRFTADDAHIKLTRFHPSFEE